MTRISFLVPTFNRAEYIAESLRSVLSQAGPDDEIVVIDDGSTDGTREAVAPFLSRIRYVRQENAGKSVALNRGLAMTDGEFVWICDDDDLLRPGVVEPMLSRLRATGAGFVFGRYTRFQVVDGVRVDLGTGYWPDLSQGSLARHILEDAFVMHNAALVRRHEYERAGGFDPAMLRSQDYDMFVRLALQSRIAFWNAIVFDQRKHPGVRGPTSAAHRADQSDTVWNRYDSRIFEKVRAHVPLAYFEGMFQAGSPELRRRAAYLQRACVLGRHGLWRAAFDDLGRAAGQARHLPLTALEQAICRRAVSGKHGFSGLVAHDLKPSLRTLRSSSLAGRAICASIARGLLWRLRGEDVVGRGDAVRYLSRPGAVLDLVRSLVGFASSNQPVHEGVSEFDPIPLASEAALGLAVSRSNPRLSL